MNEPTSQTEPASSPASALSDQEVAARLAAAIAKGVQESVELQAEADAIIARNNRAIHVLNWLRVLAVLVYPIALLGGMVWLFARFGPGWGLVAVLFLGVLMLFNRPSAPPAA